MGDLNLNWLNKSRRKRLKDITNKFQMSQMISSPTRLTSSSQTLLDLIFTNKPDRMTKTYNLITGTSDHNLILVARKLSKMRYKNQNAMEGGKYISFIPKKNLEPFENELRQTEWNDTIPGVNCEQTCDDLMSTIKQIISKYTKTVPRKHKAKRNLPWFNDTLWHLMKKRDLALKKSLKSGLSTDRLIYKGLRNKVTMQLRKAKANFFLEIIKDAKGKNKILWKSIDKLSGREHPKNEDIQLKLNGTHQVDSLVIANNFNDYFINSVLELGQNFTQTHLNQIFISDETALNLKPTNEIKVNTILSSLSNSTAKDIHGLDTVFLKKYRDNLIAQVTQIINQSFQESTFPSALKPAIVTPIYKSGDQQEMSNYRPISILPVISKVVEKAVAEQLVEHLDSEALLHPMQFGFRTNHSTETACCYFLETIKLNLDKGEVVGAVFFRST